MHLLFFPVNNAYAFVFGHDLRTAQLIRMIGHEMFFQTRREAVEAARFCGLLVSPKGVVTSDAEVA